MDYFKKLQDLLKTERQEDKSLYEELAEKSSVLTRRENGLAWYPIAIRDTEISKGDYLTVEVERTTHQDILHQLRSGSSAALFSNHNPKTERAEGVIAWQGGNRLKITLRTDELPDWSQDGKLGIDLMFDDNSYDEMVSALKLATVMAEKSSESQLIHILTGQKQPSFNKGITIPSLPMLNASQQEAVKKILAGNEVAIVHGPPGTGKTTTLVQAIKALIQQEPQQILVVAPSNTAVDLLSEKLSEQGLNVLRIGNPARVSERLLSLTLDSKMTEQSQYKSWKSPARRKNG